jgi:putative methyltransferase (TIGR04325 family)
MLGGLTKKALDLTRDALAYPCFCCTHEHPSFCVLRGRKCANETPRYRGVYASYEAAMAALPPGQSDGFDTPVVTDFFLKSQFMFNPGDYPVLLRLQQILREGNSVFDLGGGFGQCYYAYQGFLHFPAGVRWVVCDVEGFARLGETVANERKVDALRFTSDRKAAEGASIYLTNGALHYIEQDLSEILSELPTKPRHVLVNRIPTYDGEPYYTVQNGIRCYLAHKVMNTRQFIEGIEKLGYERVDQWSLPRSLRVPFHPKQFVPHYQGFYFVLRELDAS